MKRAVLAMAVIVSVLFVPSAQADGLTKNEARSAAVEHTFENVRVIPYSFGPVKCQRSGQSGFRCLVAFTGEFPRALKRCRVRVRVFDGSEVRTRTLGRKCRKIDRPFLPEAVAWRTAVRLADSSFNSQEYDSFGASIGRESMTRMVFQFSWSNDDQACIQEIKVALIDGKVKGNAGEAACVSGVPWPTSAALDQRGLIWSDSWRSEQ